MWCELKKKVAHLCGGMKRMYIEKCIEKYIIEILVTTIIIKAS